MKRIRLLCLCVGVMALLTGVSAAEPAEGVPTFTKDVAPIMFDKCVVCHRPGEVAPMSLQTYKNVRPWAKGIKEKVLAREMPPWFADPNGSVKFRNDRRLSQEQIDTIVAWVDSGAPQGNEADLPPQPEFAEGWMFGEPDFIVDMPVEYQIPAEGLIENTTWYSPPPFEEDYFVDAIEMRPGNRAVVHHSNINPVQLPEGTSIVGGQAFRADGTPLPRSEAEDVFDDQTQFISYVPGRGYESWPDGVGKRVPGGKSWVWSQHYQATGRPETDRSRVGLYYTDTPIIREVFRVQVNTPFPGASTASKRAIVQGKDVEYNRYSMAPIPAYAEGYTVAAVMPVLEDISILAFQPHMHLRGKSMEYIATYPDGRQQRIFTLPDYDFNWQLHYEVEEPLHIPAGSTIIGIQTYDNTPKNRYNPAPDQDVPWGPQSWEEMFGPRIHFTIDSQDLRKQTDMTDQQ